MKRARNVVKLLTEIATLLTLLERLYRLWG